MYEYKYVPVEREGWIFAGFQGYREVIDRELRANILPLNYTPSPTIKLKSSLNCNT